VLVLRYYEDMSEEQIAATLGCAPGTVKTVETHLTRAYRKLGVTGRGELGAALN